MTSLFLFSVLMAMDCCAGLADLPLSSGEELSQISLDQAKLLVGLHKRTDPFGQLFNGPAVGKPGDRQNQRLAK